MPPFRPGRAAAMVAVALSLVSAPAAFAAGREHRTEHYDLYVDTPDLDASDTGRMLEALHRRLTRFFGRAPEGRLRIEIYPDQEAFLAALERDNQPWQSGAGLYGPTFRKVWLAAQPTLVYTRQLVLHEATHQFHFLVATGNEFPSTLWYTEGLAEYFGLHTWDGRVLQTGVVPAITLEDYPARAETAFIDAGWPVAAALKGTVDVGQAGSWALVHFLATRYPEEFRRLGQALDERQDPVAAFDEVLGAHASTLNAGFRSWMTRHRQPFEWVWNAWQQRGSWIEGESDVVALARLKDRPERFEVEMEALTGDRDGGLVFGYRGRDDFHALLVGGDGTVRILRRFGGRWERIATHTDVPVVGGPRRLVVERQGEDVVLQVDGGRLGQMRAPGDVGLMVDSSRVRFRVVDAGREVASLSDPR